MRYNCAGRFNDLSPSVVPAVLPRRSEKSSNSVTLAVAIASTVVVAGTFYLLNVSAFAQKGGDIVRVGPLTIRQEGDTKVVTSGWSRKNGNVALAPGGCAYIVDVIPPNTLRFTGGINYLILYGELRGHVIGTGGQFTGKQAEDLEDPDFTLMRETGEMTSIVDANGCNWTFGNAASFQKAGVTIAAEKGATISFSLTGSVVTRGISFTKRTPEEDALLEASRLGDIRRVNHCLR